MLGQIPALCKADYPFVCTRCTQEDNLTSHMKNVLTKAAAVVFFSFTLLLTSSPVHAAYGLGTTAQQAGIRTDKGIAELAGDIVNSGLSLLGIVFFGIILYGGVLWMIARGDSTTVTKAKDTITHAIIGLAVVAGAYAITEFTLNALSTGTTGGTGNQAAQENCDCNNPVGNACVELCSDLL